MLAKSLQQGDMIGIIAPSKPFSKEKQFELENFIEYMKTQEINVILSEHFYSQEKKNLESVSAEDRASDINSMFANKNIDAIWCFLLSNSKNTLL